MYPDYALWGGIKNVRCLYRVQMTKKPTTSNFTFQGFKGKIIKQNKKSIPVRAFLENPLFVLCPV